MEGFADAGAQFVGSLNPLQYFIDQMDKIEKSFRDKTSLEYIEAYLFILGVYKYEGVPEPLLLKIGRLVADAKDDAGKKKLTKGVSDIVQGKVSIRFSSLPADTAGIGLHRIPDPLPADIWTRVRYVLSVWYCIFVW